MVVTKTRKPAPTTASLRQLWHGDGEPVICHVRRLGAMGDVVMATALCLALKERTPNAVVYLQTTTRLIPLFQGAAGIDLCGDYPAGDATEFYDCDLAYERRQSQNDWVHPARAFCDLAGLPLPAGGYTVTEAPECREWAANALPDGPLYVACGLRSCYRPKANWFGMEWLRLATLLPDVRFVALDAHCKPALGRDGDGGFYHLPNVVDLTGQAPSLRHLAALLRCCRACVSVDTGMLHLAAACGLPVVGLFGGVPSASRLPWHVPAFGLDGEAECFPCHNPARCCRQGRHCLESVRAEQAANALQTILR